MDATHDPALKSWLASANDPGTDFPIQNLPLGVFKRRGDEAPRVGTAVGDRVLDIPSCLEQGLLDGAAAEAASSCRGPSLNALMALEPRYRSALRQSLSRLLQRDASGLRDHAMLPEMLRPVDEVELQLPCVIGDYTDFYASILHAQNVGRMFRPDNPLLPNYRHVPIAYHGRASSVVPSGTAVRRPSGQVQDEAGVHFSPTKQLDYELEVGFYVASGNPLGHPIPIAEAESRIFGLCLVNDWSARDIQRWEYQPLGPFLGKSFATTVSPWVITLEALEPFRVAAYPRSAEDPNLLPYLQSPSNEQSGGFDLTLEVFIQTNRMRRERCAPVRLTRAGFKDMYWTPAQMVAHHASNGCNLRPGDLIASGTVSGAAEDARGCLLELAARGKKPICLPNGEQRSFLEDGDEVIMRGYCERPGFARIGFGDCRGLIIPASESN